MAACEEALATPGLAAVIHEYGPLYEKADLWQKSARRLQLACERGSATAFMIGAAGAASGFESAWRISPAMNMTKTTDWRPIWRASVGHVRGGYPAEADLIWDKTQACFVRPVAQDDTAPTRSPTRSWQHQPYRNDTPSHHQLRWQKSA